MSAICTQSRPSIEEFRLGSQVNRDKESLFTVISTSETTCTLSIELFQTGEEPLATFQKNIKKNDSLTLFVKRFTIPDLFLRVSYSIIGDENSSNVITEALSESVVLIP